MKKLLFLGGSPFQVPAIKYAKHAGYYVITADYKPDNPGHEYSDEYHNVSTVDKEAILELSEKCSIHGILSYASDPGAPTAAFVAEQLGLPGNPYESVQILQQKDLFRKFLFKNGFNTPKSDSFTKLTASREFSKNLLLKGPIIVKPVDSSGSKGVRKLDTFDYFDDAFEHAMSFSINKKVVVEEFIEKKGYQMDGDGFAWKSNLAFSCFGTQHKDLECSANIPVGISFPYVARQDLQDKARQDIERVVSLLKLDHGGLNIEFIISEKEEIYILEIGPRSGGNLIPEVIKYSTGVDLIAASVEGALGHDCGFITNREPEGFYSSYILHSTKTGTFKSVYESPFIKSRIVEKNILAKVGDTVSKFEGSHHTLGTYILKFDNHEEMLNTLDNMNNEIRVDLNK